MTINIQIPEFSESISEGTIGAWIKNVGDQVTEGETIVEVETDKVVLEIPSPANGVIEKIIKSENETVNSQEVIGILVESQAAAEENNTQQAEKLTDEPKEIVADSADENPSVNASSNTSERYHKSSPAVRKLIEEKGVDKSAIKASGKNNRITKADVIATINVNSNSHSDKNSQLDKSSPLTIPESISRDKKIERIPMSSLRKRISDRLVAAQQEYAMLTTFNEVNMQQILSIRANNKDKFFNQHGVKLGFMSFFVLAVVEALKQHPILNASVENNDIVYHRYVDMGIAVSAERGLVVPVVRNADAKSLSSIELEINQLANKARENKLSIDELIGGTFTITNGGVFGSMLSTPIVNPPQSAILGMHSIEKRPIVVEDEIKVGSMMYLALSYDHRIIDGREAVLFLSHIKTIIEDPIQLLLHL